METRTKIGNSQTESGQTSISIQSGKLLEPKPKQSIVIGPQAKALTPPHS